MNDDELQTGDLSPETRQEAGAESATAEAGDPGQVQQDSPAEPASDAIGAGATKRINELTYQRHEADRQRQIAEQELASLKSQLFQQQQQKASQIPPAPDPFDDDYAEQLQAREAAIAESVRLQTLNDLEAAHAKQQQQLQQQQQQQELQTAVADYSRRAGEMNISPQSLQAAGEVVAAYGISDEVTRFILADDKGPAITQHLAQNPAQIEKLKSLNDLQAAVWIGTELKPNLSASQTAAPPPPDMVGGTGVSASTRGPEGAKFE